MELDRTEPAGPRSEPLAVDEGPRRPLVARVAGSAFNLVFRFGLTTLLSGLSAIAITRLLGPSNYGQYATAIATWSVLGAGADFGFTLMLARDMARAETGRHRPMLRSAYEVGLMWSLALAIVLVGLAVSAGPTSTRGIELLLLAPSMAINGLNPARAFFEITYETRKLLIIDVSILVVQVITMVVLAASGLGPIAVTLVVSIGSIVGNLAVSYVASRMLEPASGGGYSRIELVRRAAPLGLLSVMTKVYLLIDLVLLGWLVKGPSLGHYAAASKLLTVLAGLSGVVMGGALPALSTYADRRVELEQLIARVWHWLVVIAVPMFIGVALFAPLIVHVALGGKYVGAEPLLRILCIAGEISVVSNIFGNLMIALHKTRALFVQNAAAIVLNVGGNLLLVPHYGVAAAAWLTAATELLVCSASLLTLRHELSFRGCARVSVRPAAAIAAATAVGLVLSRWQLPAAIASSALFVALLSVFRGWPSEFRLGRLRPAA
jgi:O-antigen/teichoic acid export membrane protein